MPMPSSRCLENIQKRLLNTPIHYPAQPKRKARIAGLGPINGHNTILMKVGPVTQSTF
jgi:hypothetical protein